MSGWDDYLDARTNRQNDESTSREDPDDAVVYYVQVFDENGETWRNVGNWYQHADAVRGYVRARGTYHRAELRLIDSVTMEQEAQLEIEEWEARDARKKARGEP